MSSFEIIKIIACPRCGAKSGFPCIPDEEENHSDRIHEFISSAPYEERLKAHFAVLQEMDEIGIDHYNESLYLTDDEIVLLNK